MGFPMAGHLARAGHDVTVYNRTTDKAARWTERYPGGLAPTPAEAAAGSDAAMICVGNDADVDSVMRGPDGILGAMRPGALLIDHSTVSARLARALAADAAARGVDFLDAPVSGGQAGAEGGALTVMVGGAAEAARRAEPLLRAYARRVGHMGPAGSGQLAKMVNQIAIAGVLQGLSEAVHFAKAAGLDAELLFDVLGKGAAQSWQMDNRALTMARGEFDFGFAIDWMRKDLGLVMEEAGNLGLTLPNVAATDVRYAAVQARGGARQDTSALIRQFEA